MTARFPLAAPDARPDAPMDDAPRAAPKAPPGKVLAPRQKTNAEIIVEGFNSDSESERLLKDLQKEATAGAKAPVVGAPKEPYVPPELKEAMSEVRGSVKADKRA